MLKDRTTTDTTALREQLSGVVAKAVTTMIANSGTGALTQAQAASAATASAAITEQSANEKAAGTPTVADHNDVRDRSTNAYHRRGIEIRRHHQRYLPQLLEELVDYRARAIFILLRKRRVARCINE